MTEDDHDEEIPDDGDPREPVLPYRPPRIRVPKCPPRKATRKALPEIEGVGSLEDLHRLRHASRDQWHDPDDEDRT